MPLVMCWSPGCPRLLARGAQCPEHPRKPFAGAKLGARARGYTRRWEKLRDWHLAQEPLCRMCKAQGRTTPANEVDHIEPHKGDQELLFDPGNLQSMCTPCHRSKSGREGAAASMRGRGASNL